MRVHLSDGGKAETRRKGTRDCAVRAVAIALGLPYEVAWQELSAHANVNPSQGYHRKALGTYLAAKGWQWTPTMKIGEGCQVHLCADELPSGTLIVRVSKHFCAVIDGVIHDNHDPSRNGTRCVYGYWSKQKA